MIAGIADCVLIFPETPGSFAETGFFSNSKQVRDKTLVINPVSEQSDSFLNLGPIHTINRFSFLQPTLLLEHPTDFTQLGQRLNDRMKGAQRARLEYRQFRSLKRRERLCVVFEILRLLRLADFNTLRHAMSVCFETTPQVQELADLLRILEAAGFIQRDEDHYFKVIIELRLIDIENVDVTDLIASVTLFYEQHSPDVIEAIAEVAP